MDRLVQIRQQEKLSHTDAYTNHELYQKGSWLQKPVKTVLDLFAYFETCTKLRALDLGCGVGRNCIAMAQYFRNISCRIDCVDILELAIEKLRENAEKYAVSESIHGVVQPLESYSIQEDTYDLILAVSALEHVDSEESFVHSLEGIRNGIRKNGIVCLIVNSSVREYDKRTGQEVPAQFEVNLEQRKMQTFLEQIFSDWTVLKSKVQDQQYDIPRGNSISDLHTKVITYVARKR